MPYVPLRSACSAAARPCAFSTVYRLRSNICDCSMRTLPSLSQFKILPFAVGATRADFGAILVMENSFVPTTVYRELVSSALPKVQLRHVWADESTWTERRHQRSHQHSVRNNV